MPTPSTDMSAREADGGTATDPLSKCGSAIDNAVSSALGKWGTFVAQNPWKVFLAFMLLLLLLAGGVSMSEEETEEGNLWTPSGAQVLDDREVFEEFFGSGFRSTTIYVKAEADGGNVITPEVLGAARQIHDKIVNNEWTVEVDDDTYGHEQLCERSRPTDPCEMRLNPVDDAFFDSATSTLVGVVPESVERAFAGVEKNEAGVIVKATTVKLSYVLSRANDTNRVESGKGANPTLVYEDFLLEELEQMGKDSSAVQVFVQAESSISKVLGSIIGGDIIGLNIGFMCIVLYAVLVLGKFHPVLSRSAVAFGGVLCVGFAILGTYGLTGYCGVPITPVTSLLPFILVGIGVDDMFVLVGSLDRAPKHLDITTRIALMMREAGSSITMTSLTDMLAFALGTTTSFPALRYFCIYAAIGIMLDYLFQCTLFVCFLVWDEQRRQARGMDCFCCVACCAKEGEKCDGCYVKEENMDKTCCSGKCCMKEGGYLRSFMRDTYAPVLKNVAVKVLVLLLMVGFLAIGIVGVTKLKEDFSLRYFVPSDDPLQEVFDINDKEYRSGETSVQVLLDHRHADGAVYLHQPAAVTEVTRVTDSVEAFVYYEDDTLSSVLHEFVDWLDTSPPPTDPKQFYDALHRFLGGEGARMAASVSVYDWYADYNTWVLDTFEGKGDAEEVTIAGAPYSKADLDPRTMRPVEAEKMCSLLKAFFAGPGADAKATVQPPMDEAAADCYPPSGDVQMHRVSAMMKCRLDEGDCPQSNATAAIEVMDGMREAMADLESPLKPIAYSYEFLDSEQFAVVRREAVTNISLAIVAVAIITLLLLAHVFAGLLVVANVAMVLIDIVGLMWIWGITINSVSIINLVLAIGLAVDYSAHIAHAFMRAVGSRDERMVSALGEMGADVAHGAVSTFVAVLVTSGSKSYIFQVFFRQFFGICFFGMIHGLLVLPVLLSLIGPPTHRLPSNSHGSDLEMQAPSSSAHADPKTNVHAVPSQAPATIDTQYGGSAPNMEVGTVPGRVA